MIFSRTFSFAKTAASSSSSERGFFAAEAIPLRLFRFLFLLPARRLPKVGVFPLFLLAAAFFRRGVIALFFVFSGSVCGSVAIFFSERSARFIFVVCRRCARLHRFVFRRIVRGFSAVFVFRVFRLRSIGFFLLRILRQCFKFFQALTATGKFRLKSVVRLREGAYVAEFRGQSGFFLSFCVCAVRSPFLFRNVRVLLFQKLVVHIQNSSFIFAAFFTAFFGFILPIFLFSRPLPLRFSLFAACSFCYFFIPSARLFPFRSVRFP